ncbi:MAG TPA: hypothetical protein VJ183_01485 [Chloroflexia bacterium]|nr:hypothetical protein [Chloroflexia bacterium]
MSLTTIYDALSRHLTGSPPNQQIDLFAAASSEDALRPLVGVLALFGIQSQYVLSGVGLNQGSGEVTLTGEGTFGVPGVPAQNLSNVRAVLVCVSPGGNDRFALSLAVTDSGWSFSKTFPSLPDTQQAVEGAVVFTPSFLIGLPLNKLTFSARSPRSITLDLVAGSPGGEGGDALVPLVTLEQLHLAGELPPGGVLANYADLFAPWPLRLEGTLVMPGSPTDYPTMDLKAISPTLTYQINGASLRDVGLQIIIEKGLDPELYGRDAYSSLNFISTLYLGANNPITGQLSVALLVSTRTWHLMVIFEPDQGGLTQGLSQLVGLFGLDTGDMPIPISFPDFGGFRVSEIEIWLAALTTPNSIPEIEHLAVSLESSKQWTPPIPFVQVRDVGIRWVIGWSQIDGQSEEYIAGSVYGSIVIGSEGQQSPDRLLPGETPGPAVPATDWGFAIDVEAGVPSFVVEGALREGDVIPIESAFRYFFGGPSPTTPEGMAITELAFTADPLNQTYVASALITNLSGDDDETWTIDLGGVSITLTSLFLQINVTQGEVTGGISGEFTLVDGAPHGMPDPHFVVGAEYSPDGWVFAGSLYPDSYVDLVSLVSKFLGSTHPSGLGTLSIERLAVQFAIGSQAYALAGTIVGRWTPTLFGTARAISATASVDISSPGGSAQAEGTLLARFAINKIAISVGMNLKVSDPTYLFKIEFGQLWLSAVTAWKGEADQRHQVLTVQLGGVTLGGILEYLVNLAAPTLGFHLDPPWDALNRIELSRFLLTIDPTENSVEFTYEANLDLVIIWVEKVGVRYMRKDGDSAVELILTGRVLGSKKDLSWDVVKDPPPTVAGQEEGVIVLRYLGLGQHITFKGETPDTVRDTIDQFQQAMKPPDDANTNPLDQKDTGMMPAADSSWLIGLDVSLLGTVDLALIFNDPRLYGLSIGLRGERAGTLAGLKFEILYKKITDDIGMFRVELRLPDAMRSIELGAVSLTIGTIVLEIYTNGNFLIDFGFPYDRDYSRSFTVQYFPFIGRGGFYFGLLNGSTSRRVPRITNGTFAPVIELGVGLAVGVGKEVRVGPLSGGAYVQVEIIFQGVLAWFNPSSSGDSSKLYYWAQGVAAIHGKVYGTVDFKVIKVSVTIEAYIQASVVFAAYKASLFRLEAAVSVEAEVEVLFFSVSYTFEAKLDISLTVGSNQPTPWVLADAQGSQQTQLVRGARPRLARDPAVRHRVLQAQHLVELFRAQRIDALPRSAASLCAGDTQEVQDTPYLLHWDTTQQFKVFSDAPRNVPATMLPAFTITDLPVGWNTTKPDNPAPQYRIAFLLFAPRSAELSAHTDGPAEASATSLIEALLRWSIGAITGSSSGAANVTAGQLQTLVEQMDRPETSNKGFSISNLSDFFSTNVCLQLSGDPGGNPARGQDAMALPLPPFLSWTSPQAGNRNFASDGEVGPLYEWGIAKYMADYLTVDVPARPQPVDDLSLYESFASFIFRDWCLMVAKAAAQAACDAMSEWPAEITGKASLLDIANRFPTVQVEYAMRSGDTVDSVAAALGCTPEELTVLNPTLAAQLAQADVGASLPVTLGIVPETVAVDNSEVPLLTGVSLVLGSISYQATSTDFLNGIATRFGLSGGEALFTGTQLADDALLLRADATFKATQITYAPLPGFTTILVAAVFYVRYFAPTEVPDTEWYAQTIFELNKDNASVNLDYNLTVSAGVTLKVPPALNDNARGHAINYTTLAGDTLMRIGAALSLAQNYSTADGPYKSWTTFRGAVQPVSGGVSLPPTMVTVLPGETVNMLADRTIIYHANITGLMTWIGDVNILNPLAVITVPGVSARTGDDGATLAAIAARFGLTVEDLARRISDISIFSGSQEGPLELKIRHLPAQRIDDLVAQVLSDKTVANIAGMSSRYLLAGLRLPAPEDSSEGHMAATGALTSVYDLTGQQFGGPQPDMSKPGEVALSLSVIVNAGTDWIELMGSSTVGGEESFTALTERVSRLQELNLGLADPGRLRPGMVVHTGVVSQLNFSYSNQDLNKDYPVTGLSVSPHDGPRSLPLSNEVPRTYGLDHHIELQSPLVLPIPGGSASLVGSASLWPFPEALVTQAVGSGSRPFEIVRAHNRTDIHNQLDTVQNATFATLLPFGIRRLDEQEHVYELRGANTADREVLLQIWQYLSNGSTPAGTQAFLLLPPAPNAGNPTGLTILPTDSTLTFLLKTNETTDTAPGLFARAMSSLEDLTPTASKYYASFDGLDLAAFVLLLWEGSVVGGSGYYLGFSTTAGQDLPASAFDSDGNASLYLLLIAGEQQPVAPDGRPLLLFNNCAIVAPGLDPTVHALYVEASDSSDLVAAAAVPPGNIGFTLTLPKAQQPTTWSAEVHLQQLFSLATYEISGSQFHVPSCGLPVGPQADDGTNLAPWQRYRLARWQRAGRAVGESAPTKDYWRYQQVVPIARFGPVSAAPVVEGLPDPKDDPYRGIAGVSLPKAVIQLGFADVVGNITAPPGESKPATPGAIEADVGYTDPLLSVSNWPGVITSFDVTPVAGSVNLTVTIAARASAITPSASQSPCESIALAKKQSEKYREIYFQVAQPQLTTWIVTTLKQAANGQPDPIQLDTSALTALWRFAAANYLAAAAAASVVPVAGSGTLGQVVSAYNLPFAQIAAANASQSVVSLFGTQAVTVPAYHIFADGDSADSIASQTRPGWPKPTNGTTLLQMPQNSNVLPLRIGNVLVLQPAISISIPAGPPALRLNDLARQHRTSAGLLASDNARASGILQTGFSFVMDGLTVTVGMTVLATGQTVSTFEDVQQAFADLSVNVTVADIGVANGAATNMLVQPSVLSSSHYIAVEGETLAHNASGATLSDLIQQNHGTGNLFDAGALVYLGDFTPQPQISPDDAGTLQEFADRYGCSPTLLLAANPDLALPGESTLVLPGTVAIPADNSSMRVPCPIIANDTLDGISSRFAPAPGSGSAAENLATANLAMPGTIASGKTITVSSGGNAYYTLTQEGDSFASVLTRLQTQSTAIQLGDLVRAIEATEGNLAPGALLVCPPASLPAALAVEGKLSLKAVAEAYGVDPVAFAQINAGLLALVAPGVTLTADGVRPPVVTGANDTFNSLVTRFAGAGKQISIHDIVAAYAEVPLLVPAALTLLPPTPTLLSASLWASAGPFAAPVFPLTVVLRLQRPQQLIDAEFHPGENGPVERADAPVPVSPGPQGSDAALTLKAFAENFEQVLPELRLGTGRVLGVSADLWVINFDSGGIDQVTVAPGVPYGEVRWPRFFALRPLYTNANTPGNYQGADIEVWAQRFLADMDLFLSAPYATGIYPIPKARGSLDKTLDAKDILSKAIPRGLATVLELSDPNGPAGLAQAADRLKQRLAVSLSRAYDTDAIVQYDASVLSAWTRGTQPGRARLDGTTTSILVGDAAIEPANLPFTLSSAKTDLDKTGSFVSFLMNVPDPAHHGNVEINLDYDFLDLEFNIDTVAGVGGYESSDWLAFMPILAGSVKPDSLHTKLGSATVPIPLRSYPAPPVLLGQAANPTHAEPGLQARSTLIAPNLGEAPLWTYSLTYSHEHAEQDEVIVTARFNITPPALMQAREDTESVADALARYVAAADELWTRLAGFAGPSGNADPERLAQAANDFADLASSVASAWDQHWPLGQGAQTSPDHPDVESSADIGGGDLNSSPNPQSYSFSVRLAFRTDLAGNVYFDKLRLASQQTQPGPTGQWPEAFYQATDGSLTKLTPNLHNPSDPNILVYTFPIDEQIRATDWPHIMLQWTGLNIATIQNARGTLLVRRNQKLLGETGPDTNPGFVYQTARVEAADIVTPFNVWPQAIDITGNGTDVASALRASFTNLFGDPLPNLPLTAGLFYGYALVLPSQASEEGLVTYLPVSLYPNQQLDANIATALANALATWQTRNNPANTRGEWVFSLTFYSQLDANTKQPLLQLDRLVYRLQVPPEPIRK